MDNRTIFSKTGKGSLEISKKAIKLSSEERQALILVDGKSNLTLLEEKLNRVPPLRLRTIFEHLLELDLIREFVTKSGPDSIMPAPGSAAAAIRVQEITEDDLDFTAFASVTPAKPTPQSEDQRKANEAADAERREQVSRQKAEVERKAREAAELAARQAAESKAKDEAERKGREAAELAARQAAESKAKDEAERKAREAAELAARQAAETKAKEEAERKAREEAERAAREAAERKEREEAERKAREEAEHNAREEAERVAREAAEHEAKLKAEARERARLEEEAKRRAIAEDAERQAQAKAADRERARLEEEAVRRQIAERQAKEEAQRKAIEESQLRMREEAERRQREAREQAERAGSLEAERQAAQASDTQRRAREEADRYTAELSPHLEAAAAPPERAATPAPMGAFSSLAELEANAPQSVIGLDEPPVGMDEAAGAQTAGTEKSHKEIEKEAKERAKQEARARKEAEKEAKRIARASGRAGGRKFATGKIIVAVLVLLVGGAIAYVFSVSADKPAIERMLSARLATKVTVGKADFTPFPAELRLTDLKVGEIVLPRVVATADIASLASSEKVWRNVDITGLTLNPAQLEKLAAIGTAEPPRAQAPSFTLQRIRALGVTISGTPMALPKFDAAVLVGAGGTLKQVTLSLPDGAAQVLLAPLEKGWQVDIESRGVTWPLGPKIGWESLRAKGTANATGIKFDELNLTVGGGVVRGSGDLTWQSGWKFGGSVDVSGVDAEAIGSVFYGVSPVAGPLEGKFGVSLAAASLASLFDTPQIDGNFLMTKVVFKTVDFARLLQGADPGGGQTRLNEMTGSIAVAGGRLQIRQVRGNSGLLNVTGSADVLADKSVSGTVNVELGAGGSRGRTTLRVHGTLADPRFGR